MHDRRVLGWGWAAGSPVHVSACHWIKVAVRWRSVCAKKMSCLRSRAVLVMRRCRLRQKYLNVFVEVVSCLTGADSGGRRWIGGAGSSRHHGCHRRGRFLCWKVHVCVHAVLHHQFFALVRLGSLLLIRLSFHALPDTFVFHRLVLVRVVFLRQGLEANTQAKKKQKSAKENHQRSKKTRLLY